MPEKPLLVADIGGTNARFALANRDQPGFSDDLSLQCADFPNVAQAIRFYLDRLGCAEPSMMCLAVAGPITDKQVKLTNNPWLISCADLSQHFPSAGAILINDFTAIAQSIPFLTSEHCLSIGEVAASIGTGGASRFAVIGPGTGLGIAGLIGDHGRYIPITTEGGHVGFAPETSAQVDLLVTLRERWPRVSAERLLSGAGIENIHWAMLQHNPERQQANLNAADIFKQAMQDPGCIAYKSVQLFFEILGQVAGDVALTLGAEGGVYIAGGMVKRYPQLLLASNFRAAFESKGRHQGLMQRIPTTLITHSQPGLLGASYYCLHPNQ